jgi:hypothetical protein
MKNIVKVLGYMAFATVLNVNCVQLTDLDRTDVFSNFLQRIENHENPAAALSEAIGEFEGMFFNGVLWDGSFETRAKLGQVFDVLKMASMEFGVPFESLSLLDKALTIKGVTGMYMQEFLYWKKVYVDNELPFVIVHLVEGRYLVGVEYSGE